MTIRRVVIGEPAPKESSFSHVEEVVPEATWPGSRYYVWGWDEKPELPYWSTAPYVAYSDFPPRGGIRVVANHYTLPQLDDPKAAMTEKNLRRREAVPFGSEPGSKPGMHRTESIDLGIMIKGKLTVEVEDGSMVTLRPGDVYVQNGAQHMWHVHPEDPALMVLIFIPAERRDGD